MEKTNNLKKESGKMVFLCIKVASALLFLTATGWTQAMQEQVSNKATRREKTTFQASSEWKPATDVRSDVAMVYGTGDRPGISFEQRIKSWRDHGYNTRFMTGMAWGGYRKSLADTKILLMPYSNMNPLSEKPHEQLAEWVRNGGIIVYSGRDDDPFQTVSEWWNTGDKKYKCPADNLFEKPGIGQKPKEGTYAAGKGKVCIIRMDPKEYVLESNHDLALRDKNVMRVLLPSAPKKITITAPDGKAVTDARNAWDAIGKTSFLSFENSPDGIKVALEW